MAVSTLPRRPGFAPPEPGFVISLVVFCESRLVAFGCSPARDTARVVKWHGDVTPDPRHDDVIPVAQLDAVQLNYCRAFKLDGASHKRLADYFPRKQGD